MKLGALVEELYLAHRNEKAVVDVETREIGLKFGTEYNGERMFYGGVNGRLTDIPAYLASCEVKLYEAYLSGGDAVHHIVI